MIIKRKIRQQNITVVPDKTGRRFCFYDAFLKCIVVHIEHCVPPQPTCCNKIDDNAEKPELSGFFGVQMPKKL